jgi:hypothetical protein
MFFLEIPTYQSTPKILYVLKGLKGTKERTEVITQTPLPCRFVQQLLQQLLHQLTPAR